MEYLNFVFMVMLTQVPLGRLLCDGQEIYFNQKDPESNEVIFTGQANVTLVCYVSNIFNANITIANVLGESVASQVCGNCLEYTIPRLTGAGDGDYTCHVDYINETSGMRYTEVSSLSLNVESGKHRCSRNGTPHEAFGIGDTLQLSCYCTITINCHWVSSVVNTSRGEILQHETLHSDDYKIVIGVTVGPLTLGDLNRKYDCFYGNALNERCSIGPSSSSSDDFVRNPMVLSRIFRECPRSLPTGLTTTTSSTPVTTVALDGGQETEERPKEGFVLYIITSGSVLLIAVVLCVVLALKRKRKEGLTERPGGVSGADAAAGTAHGNASYDESAYASVDTEYESQTGNGSPSYTNVSLGVCRDDPIDRDGLHTQYDVVIKSK